MRYKEVFIINRTPLNPDYGYSTKEISNTLYIPVIEGEFKGQYRAIYGVNEVKPEYIPAEEKSFNHIEEMWLECMLNNIKGDDEYSVYPVINLSAVAELSASRRTR